MDKNAIKKYAVWARRELISRVSQKAYQYGIRENDIVDANADSIDGKLLTDSEKKERQALIVQVKEKGFEHVMEEVAYTWFNRFSALRFMEVNGYLPSHVRVFTDDENNFKPQIITEAIHLELDGLDMDKVYAYIEADNKDELYKYLLITQCNALNKILPGMFQKIADYTELLFPDNLLREGSVVEQMIAQIPEDDWKDAVQIIGWLYQYYIAEPKDTLINARSKYKKDDVPFVTQLFTPDWIVRYMVENSLGRFWLEGHPNDELKAKWKYYIDEAQQEADVWAQLDKIREEYKTIKPEEIKVIDPCMGSGHILVYAFDVLMQIYEAYGYNQRNAAKSIVENNLYGLDIDERAAQLAYFAVMMKARQYDRRLFNHGVQPHVYAIRGSNHLNPFCVDYFVNGDAKLKADMQTLIEELHDAKEYGSILNVTNVDFDAMYARFDEIRSDINIMREAALNELLPFVQVAHIIAQKYDIVITNPPYLNASYMPDKLKKFVQSNYADFKSDLFAAFACRILQMCKTNGHVGLLMPYVWMFISSYEKMRDWLNRNANITSLVQFEYNAFEAACVPVAALTLCKTSFHSKGEYIKLSEFKGVENQAPRTLEAIKNPKCGYRYTAVQSDFEKIPGSPIAYWVSKKFIRLFDSKTIYNYAEVQEGLKTGDNERFIRKWYEVDFTKTYMGGTYNIKWFYHTKGGGFRKWYGNQEDVLNFENDGRELRNFKGSSLTGYTNYFSECITYSRITSEKTSFRYTYESSIPNMAGLALYPNDDSLYILGWLNTNIVCKILSVTNPTINFPPGTIGKLPITIEDSIKENVSFITNQNIKFSKTDWDSFEISWDFKRHPLLDNVIKDEQEARVIKQDGQGKCMDTKTEVYLSIENAYENWKRICNDRFNQLKSNEEELNRIFIDIYGLQDELTPEVEDKDITVHRIYDNKEDVPDSMKGSNYILTKQDVIKSLISYAVGCMFGRYSLDVDGLAYAGGNWDATKYKTYPADEDNIIPICDDEYFPDDIVGRFVKFIETVYGADTLEENLKFIADALGGKGTPRDVIRSYFLNDFYADHCKMYKKRPIYWLFDSGKKNGFKALIYMHRYQPDTIARMRTDYVHEQQERYHTAIAHLEQRINDASTSERVKLNKELDKLQDQANEIRIYEEKIHHLADQMIRIDLDDGVKHNYDIFRGVLAKIK